VAIAFGLSVLYILFVNFGIPFKKKFVAIEVPVFGRVVRTDWGGLLGFREYPFLRQFGNPDPRSVDGQPCINHLEKEDRIAVENWRNPTEKLASISNNGLVVDILNSYGVFDLYIAVSNNGLPTPAQQAAYQQFLADEEKVCATLLNALIRYYLLARKTKPDWFSWLDAEELIDNPDATTFAKLAGFQGMAVCGSYAKGESPLKFSFRPIWILGPGFAAIVYRGQVIMMGPEAGEFVRGDPNQFLKENEEHGIWTVEHMTGNEKEAFDEFVSNYKRGPNVDS
jgi:hypothetical protein